MTTLNEAARAYERAKLDHAIASKALDVAHAALVALADKKDEGAVTTETDAYKVTVTYGVNRTVDQAALSAIRDRVPVALFEQAFEYAAKIKLPGLRYLQSNEPETYAVLAQAVTAKPAKPSIKVEAVAAQQEAA